MAFWRAYPCRSGTICGIDGSDSVEQTGSDDPEAPVDDGARLHSQAEIYDLRAAFVGHKDVLRLELATPVRVKAGFGRTMHYSEKAALSGNIGSYRDAISCLDGESAILRAADPLLTRTLL